MKTSSVDQLILDMVAHEPDHFTSQNIYEGLKTMLPAVNRSTVYRSLDRLVGAGKVSVSDVGTGSLVYELVGQGIHHHLVCRQCQQIICISLEDVEQFFNQVEQKSRYKIITNHLILYGICENCLDSGKSAP
ncbi:MAG: Fur family transcriptional regulator [Leptolinea sp.]